VLQEADITGHEGGGREPEELPEREVPWHDGENGPDRLIRDPAPVRRGVHGPLGDEIGGVIRVEPARPRALLRLGLRGAEGLSHLPRHQLGPPAAVGLEDVGRATHPAGSLLQAGAAIRQERLGGPGQASIELIVAQRLVDGNDLARGRVHAVHPTHHTSP
jgi:hypothetical protein